MIPQPDFADTMNIARSYADNTIAAIVPIASSAGGSEKEPRSADVFRRGTGIHNQ